MLYITDKYQQWILFLKAQIALRKDFFFSPTQYSVSLSCCSCHCLPLTFKRNFPTSYTRKWLGHQGIRYLYCAFLFNAEGDKPFLSFSVSSQTIVTTQTALLMGLVESFNIHSLEAQAATGLGILLNVVLKAMCTNANKGNSS